MKLIFLFGILTILSSSLPGQADTQCSSLFFPELVSSKFKVPEDVRRFQLAGKDRPFPEVLELNGLELVSVRAIHNDPANGYSVVARYLGDRKSVV